MGVGKGRIGLQLPEQGKPAKGAFDIRPKRVEEWVQSLPTGDVGETARRVYQTLHEVNRLRHAPTDRFHFMELLREPIAYVEGALGKRFIGVSFPLPNKTRQVAKLAQALLMEMALGYKFIAEETRSTNVLLRDKQLLMTSIHRAIRYLSQALLTNYQLYAPHPAGSWRELHLLYLCAEQLKLHTTPLKDSWNAKLPESSIARGYKQMLMLALASPYRLRQGEAEAIYHALGRWAAHTDIIPFNHPKAEAALFVVHMDSDSEPDYHAFDHRHCDSDACRMVETHQLSHLLRDELHYLVEHKVKPEHGLSNDLLHRLILAWGVAPKRDFNRSERQGTIEVVIGISSLHQALAAAYGKASVSAHRSHFESKSVPMLNSRAADIWGKIFDQELPSMKEQREAEENTPPPTYSSQHWLVHNESAGGYRLGLEDKPDSQVQVGELLGLHTNTSDPLSWAVGAVRWIRQSEQRKGLELGVQILSPSALPVEMTSPKHPGEPQRGLLLPELELIKQRASIVTPTLLFEHGDEVSLHNSGHTTDIILGQLKQESGLFNQFHFTVKHKKEASSVSASNKPLMHDDFDALWKEL